MVLAVAAVSAVCSRSGRLLMRHAYAVSRLEPAQYHYNNSLQPILPQGPASTGSSLPHTLHRSKHSIDHLFGAVRLLCQFGWLWHSIKGTPAYFFGRQGCQGVPLSTFLMPAALPRWVMSLGVVADMFPLAPKQHFNLWLTGILAAFCPCPWQLQAPPGCPSDVSSRLLHACEMCKRRLRKRRLDE